MQCATLGVRVSFRQCALLSCVTVALSPTASSREERRGAVAGGVSFKSDTSPLSSGKSGSSSTGSELAVGHGMESNLP